MVSHCYFFLHALPRAALVAKSWRTWNDGVDQGDRKEEDIWERVSQRKQSSEKEGTTAIFLDIHKVPYCYTLQAALVKCHHPIC